MGNREEPEWSRSQRTPEQLARELPKGTPYRETIQQIHFLLDSYGDSTDSFEMRVLQDIIKYPGINPTKILSAITDLIEKEEEALNEPN